MEIVLHMGAHKTATTYLQTLLHRNTEVLRRHRIDLAHPRRLRPMFRTAPRPRYASPRRQRIATRAWTFDQIIANASDLGRNRVVISEEQLIGSLRPIMQGRGLYRDIAREARAVSTTLEDRPVKVMLSIRSYDSFFVSAYGQMLRGSGYLPFSAMLRRNLLEDKRGWPEVLTDLMRALPKGAELKLWRYERFTNTLPGALSELLGERAARDIQPFNGIPLPGPTGTVIEAIEARVRANDIPEPEEIRRLFREYGKDAGYAAFEPWTEEERSLLQRRYQDDIARIRDLWPGAFICDAAAPAEIATGVASPPAGRRQFKIHETQSGVSM